MSDSTPETIDELREKWRGVEFLETGDEIWSFLRGGGRIIATDDIPTMHTRLTALRDALAPGYEKMRECLEGCVLGLDCAKARAALEAATHATQGEEGGE